MSSFKDDVAKNDEIYHHITDDIYFSDDSGRYLAFDEEGALLNSYPTFSEANIAVMKYKGILALDSMVGQVEFPMPDPPEDDEEENAIWLISLTQAAEEKADAIEREEAEDFSAYEEFCRSMGLSSDFEEEEEPDMVKFDNDEEDYLYEHSLYIDPNWSVKELALHVGDSVRASIILWGSLQSQ